MSQTVEVRFKGTRKAYFLWEDEADPIHIKDAVIVEDHAEARAEQVPCGIEPGGLEFRAGIAPEAPFGMVLPELAEPGLGPGSLADA